MIRLNPSLMGALASLREVERQVNDTLRRIDPNSIDPTLVKSRQDARMIQVQASQKASEIASSIRKAPLDVEA